MTNRTFTKEEQQAIMAKVDKLGLGEDATALRLSSVPTAPGNPISSMPSNGRLRLDFVTKW